MSAESSPVKQEKSPQLLARITFSRHEETAYTGVGRDITERGVARAQEKGKKIAQEKGTPVLFGHSPKERAKGTAESIEEGTRENVGQDSERARWIRVPGLRSTDFRDEKFLKQLFEELGTGQEAWTDAHYNKPEFYDNPGKVETNEEKRTRLYRELERLISFMEKRELKGEAPHLVFVSHYEILSLLLDDVFGIETFGSTNTPTFGEHVDIDLYKPLPNGDVPIRVHYGGHEKEVLFDRKLRRLVAKPA
jgi:broad specificity phosphatase PhoE